MSRDAPGAQDADVRVPNLATDPGFADFLRGQGSRATRPVAIAPVRVARALGTTERKVLMSYETAAKQSKHALHPADYDFLTKMMVQGKMLRRKPYHIDFILEDEDGKPWHAVLKATRAGDAIYLASLRRSHQSDVRRLHRRGQPIPEPGT